MNTDHLPRPLITFPTQGVGQVVALVMDPKRAYLGWSGYTVSPPAAQDLWFPVMGFIEYGSVMFERGLSAQFMERRLAPRKECFRFFQFQSIVYECDLDPETVERYHNMREQLWPNSCAPSA